MRDNELKLSRLVLAGLRDPRVIANAIHRQLGRIEPPVPGVEIAKALDIGDVRQSAFDGFEGMLLTDRV